MKRIAFFIALVTPVALTQGRGPAPVVTAPVAAREVSAGRTFVGAVSPARRTTVGSETDGRVETFLATEGQRLGENDPLATLRTRIIDLRLAAARAELASRAADLAELKAGSRAEEKAQAAARVEQAKAELELAAWKRANAERLRKAETLSEDELKEAILAVRVAEARLAQESAQQELVEEGPRAERIAQAQARYDVEVAEIARLEEEKKRHTIRAPFAGYVVLENTQVGAWLKTGDAVAELVELDSVDIVLPVLEDYISGIRKGMAVAVTVDALPGELFDGVVVAVVPQADMRARTFPVKVRIKNRVQGDAPMLKAGMFARAQLAVGEKVSALLVPKDALVLSQGPPMVWVVDKGIANPVPVRLGIAVDDLIQVIGNVQAGQQVVVRGNERLRPGQPVSTGR